MTWNRVERRSSELRMPLPAGYGGMADRRSLPAVGHARLFDAATGFYTMPALLEFIQYEIDGSAQTLRNELYVTPLCAVAIEVDALTRAADEDARRRVLEVVGDAIRRTTRGADRVARGDDHFVALLRRTMARSVHDHYAPRLAANVTDAAGTAGPVPVLSMGVASLVEHLVKNPEDMVRKALRALEVARATPGSAVIYDVIKMRLE